MFSKLRASLRNNEEIDLSKINHMGLFANIQIESLVQSLGVKLSYKLAVVLGIVRKKTFGVDGKTEGANYFNSDQVSEKTAILFFLYIYLLDKIISRDIYLSNALEVFYASNQYKKWLVEHKNNQSKVCYLLLDKLDNIASKARKDVHKNSIMKVDTSIAMRDKVEQDDLNMLLIYLTSDAVETPGIDDYQRIEDTKQVIGPDHYLYKLLDAYQKYNFQVNPASYIGRKKIGRPVFGDCIRFDIYHSYQEFILFDHIRPAYLYLTGFSKNMHNYYDGDPKKVLANIKISLNKFILYKNIYETLENKYPNVLGNIDYSAQITRFQEAIRTFQKHFNIEEESDDNQANQLRIQEAVEILGLNRSTWKDVKILKKAYQKLALQNHPDKHDDNPLFKDRFQVILGAYQYLLSSLDTFDSNEQNVSAPFAQEETLLIEDDPCLYITDCMVSVYINMKTMNSLSTDDVFLNILNILKEIKENGFNKELLKDIPLTLQDLFEEYIDQLIKHDFFNSAKFADVLTRLEHSSSEERDLAQNKVIFSC